MRGLWRQPAVVEVARSVQPVVEYVCVNSGALEYGFPMFFECVGDGGWSGCELVVVGEDCADVVGSTWD